MNQISRRAGITNDSYRSDFALDVLPFDRIRAEAFLSKRFPNLPKIIDRGLRLASALTSSGEKYDFLPFILDIVANMIQKQIESDSEIEDPINYPDAFRGSPLVFSKENDRIVYRVCAREERKYLHGLRAEQQVGCLLDLAVKYRGIVGQLDVRNLIEGATNITADESQVRALQAHPLLHVDGVSLRFKYDVIREHFRNIFVSHLFRRPEPLTSDGILLLAERNRFDTELLKECVERIGLGRDDLVFRAIAILENLVHCDHIDLVHEYARARTTVFLMVLQQRGLLGMTNREEATSVLVDLFKQGGVVKGLSLVDVREKVSFDLRGLTIENSTFVNYDNFWDCEFDNRTQFRNCNLRMLRKSTGLMISARRSNFDLNTCTVDGTIMDALSVREEAQQATRNQKLDDLSLLFRTFYKSGRLYPQRIIVIRSKYRGSWPIQDVLRSLREKGVLRDYDNYKKATLGPELEIVSTFHPDVRKLILENHATEKMRRLVREME